MEDISFEAKFINVLKSCKHQTDFVL